MEKFDKKAIDAKVAAGFPLTDRWHNRFHLEMPFGLINDPNGLTFADGEYHIFYQWNPLGCEHKNKCWARVRTRDFVHYSMPELSLWPSDEHDKDGCYSGCGFTEKGKVHVFYTCNAKNDGVRTPAQRFGTLQEDGHVEKGAIVVPDSPEGITGHFRDPYLFHRHGRRYFVIGAQADEEKPRGTVLVYKETKEGWQNLGELKTRLKDFGYMWECPNMLHFGSYDALIFCPQGLEAREFDRQNIYQAGYIAGHLSLDSMDMMQHLGTTTGHTYRLTTRQRPPHVRVDVSQRASRMPTRPDDVAWMERRRHQTSSGCLFLKHLRDSTLLDAVLVKRQAGHLGSVL